MPNKTEKPYVLRAAEFIYSNITTIKKQNPQINNEVLKVFVSMGKKLKAE